MSKIKKRKKRAAAPAAPSSRKWLTWLPILLVCAVFITLLLILICQPRLPKLKTDSQGGYRDTKTGITYYNTVINYEPEATGKAYCRIGDTVLYEIPGLDPTQWLSEEYDGIGSIFYNSEISLPTLREFQAVTCNICVVDAVTIQINAVENQEEVDRLVDALVNGTPTTVPQEYEDFYHLKFTSETYPHLFYDVLYMVTSDGCYLYDRGQKRAIKVEHLLKDYLTGEYADPAESGIPLTPDTPVEIT